ncbi:MAG TPA: hydroxymethylglutaryl-CoA lyase [Negativicutes bacterium]|nr:hydroxymethylglutaryl-CoA lyase [Negativicutes bacterium]
MKLPSQVKITEVGPRDGFQNIKAPIPTAVKQEVVDAIIAAGVKNIEVTSFVHPKAVPQMADAAEVAQAAIAVQAAKGLSLFALVPNLTGAKKAYECGIREVNCVISVSEKHNLANVNRTREQSLADLAAIIAELPDLKVRLAAATVFGCPFAGSVPVEDVLSLVEAAVAAGVSSVTLCDTIGVGNPQQVHQISRLILGSFPDMPIALHLHDTRGMGLANTLAGLQAGITTFETSIGGLGGCPFAPGAAGNTATEDTVNMLHAMGIATGIDLARYLAAVDIVKAKIQPRLTGHMANACSFPGI